MALLNSHKLTLYKRTNRNNSFLKRRRKLIDKIGLYILVIPFCLFIFYESTEMITRSWVMLEGSSEPGGLPIVFLLKSSIYIFSFLIFVQAIEKLKNK